MPSSDGPPSLSIDHLAGWLYNDLSRAQDHPLVTREFCLWVAKGVLSASDDLAAAFVMLGKRGGGSLRMPTHVWEVVSAARAVVALWKRYQRRGDRDSLLEGVSRLVEPVESLEKVWQSRKAEEAV